MHQNADRANKPHHAMQLVHSPVVNIILKTIHASSKTVSSDYTELMGTLQERPDYQPVFLNDLAPKDRYEQRKWLIFYRYPHGNNLGTMNFAWKVPDEVDQTLNHQTIAQLNKSQKLYFTRQMRTDFLDKYTHLSSRVSRKSKAILQNMFRTFVQDESAPSTSAAEAAIDDRVATCLLDLDDPDIVMDMGSLTTNQVQVSLIPSG